MTDVGLAMTAVGSEAAARKLAVLLVEEKLAACVNMVPEVLSVYRWQGQVRHEREWLLLIKTTAQALTALEARLKAVHEYELPEFVVIAVEDGSADYLQWIAGEVALLS